MKIKKLFVYFVFIILFNINSNLFANDLKKDCLNISKWNVAKKLECQLKKVSEPVSSKINESTEVITSKKTLFDFFKKKDK